MQDGYKYNDDENRCKGELLFQAYSKFVNDNDLFPEEKKKERANLKILNYLVYGGGIVSIFFIFPLVWNVIRSFHF